MFLSRILRRRARVALAGPTASDRCCASIEALLVESVPLIAARCDDRAAQLGLGWINERDQLQPWSEEVVGELVDTSGGCSVGRNRAVAMPEWPRVGRIDLTMANAGIGTPAFIELKCGRDRDALTACAWDLLKVSLALQRADTQCAYLLAATTTDLWRQPIRGSEFFEDAEWDLDTVRTRFEDWWREWQRRGDPLPVQVPAGGRTTRLAAAGFHVAGVEWDLRLSRVSDPGPLKPWVQFP